MVVLAALQLVNRNHGHFRITLQLFQEVSNIIYFHHDFDITVSIRLTAWIILITVRIKNHVLYGLKCLNKFC